MVIFHRFFYAYQNVQLVSPPPVQQVSSRAERMELGDPINRGAYSGCAVQFAMENHNF
jgi:hypothetical protein